MNVTLEARYRRLLALYPAEHRREHQDEMLGVLMTGARAGQLRPGLRETADLIWGTLLIRLRPARRDSGWPLWRDALAVVSLLLPLIMLAYFVTVSVADLGLPAEGTSFLVFAIVSAWSLGGWLILAVLTLLRLRRTAVLAAAALLSWQAYVASFGGYWYYLSAASMVALAAVGLELAALAASPGPARARQILGWKHYASALAIPAGLAVRRALAPGRVRDRDRDHLLRAHAGRPGPGVTPGPAPGGSAEPPGLLPDRGDPRAAVADRRPLRVHLGMGWDAPDHAEPAAARGAALPRPPGCPACRPARPGQRRAILGPASFRALSSASGEMLEKGQDAGNPIMHVITGPGGCGYNPDDNKNAHDPAQYFSQHAFPSAQRCRCLDAPP